MTLQTLTGPTTLTRFLFWAACTIVAADFLATIITIIYQRYWYRKILRPKFTGGYAPRCAVIVPCKGNNNNLKSNLESFLHFDYPDYEVVFVTESAEDPAGAVIREIVNNRPGITRHVTAGISSSCAQKNHNLLAAILATKNAETGVDVFVFADSDIKPGPQWLYELILPLADPDIAVTTGFRWLRATKGSVAEWTHAYANIFIYIVFSCAFFLGGVGLWGGSMAMRREDFEKLGVAKKWSTAVVDDLSLSQIVHKKKLKGVMVPSCMAHTDELLTSIKAGVAWFERQIMFLKVYFKHLWLFLGLPLVVVSSMLILALPAALLFSLSEQKTFFGSGGGAALVFYIGELITVSLYPLLGSMPRFHRFLLCQPFIRATHAVSYFGTCTKNSITWAGVRYRLKFFGDVKRVERPSTTASR
ncbi:MAG: glycosyltransferase family 2 protein [Chitinispirillaceae bacterium]